MLYSASTLLLLLAVQSYKHELSILPICKNQSANLKGQLIKIKEAITKAAEESIGYKTWKKLEMALDVE